MNRIEVKNENNKRFEIWSHEGKLYIRNGLSSDKFGTWNPIRDEFGSGYVSKILDDERLKFIENQKLKQKEKVQNRKGLFWS